MTDATPDHPVRITRIQAWAYRCPNDVPVATSFGTMRDRPAVFLRIEDADGAFGWGEVFANWPSAGAEHRVELLRHDVAELVFGRDFDSPDALFRHLDRATRIRALQCGEEGPFRQVVAGLDLAIWDLFARRAGLPLRRLLNPAAADRVPAYASGIHYRAAPRVIPQARAQGFRDFKVKVAFDEGEAPAVRAILDSLHPGEKLAVDANQGWTISQAVAFLRDFGPDDLAWIEEPLPAYQPFSDLTRLGQMMRVPIAGGENITGYTDFAHALSRSPMAVLQPDVIKWGGISGCWRVAQATLQAGRRYCPHYLGGGIGLAASAEVLAAAGGDGLLEVDVNPNPLREEITATADHMADGHWTLGTGPGLGVDALPASLDRHRTLSAEIRPG